MQLFQTNYSLKFKTWVFSIHKNGRSKDFYFISLLRLHIPGEKKIFGEFNEIEPFVSSNKFFLNVTGLFHFNEIICLVMFLNSSAGVPQLYSSVKCFLIII